MSKLLKMDYGQYVRVQRRTTARKLKENPDRHYATDDEMSVIVEYLKGAGVVVVRGICHGSRNGWEVRKFKEMLGARVIGTDICGDAAKHPDVVCHDFHEPLKGWDGRADFVYSNSLDHSYDPDKAIACWMTSLSPDGRLLVSWSPGHGEGGLKKHNGDIYGASLDEYREMLNRHGVVDAELAVGERVVLVVRRKAK